MGSKRHRSLLPGKPAIDRLQLITIVYFLFAVASLGRLFLVMIVKHADYTVQAQGQREDRETLLPKRGQIFWHDTQANDSLAPAAINKTFWSVYAVPSEVQAPQVAAEKLAPLVGWPAEKLLTKLNQPNDPYELLKDHVDDSTLEAVKSLHLKGIYFQPGLFRSYPQEEIGAQVLGFVPWAADDRRGQYGIEGQFEQALAGNAGSLRVERDNKSRPIMVAERQVQAPQDGSAIVLTLDRAVEYTACTGLKQAVIKNEADRGSVIISDPNNGRIIAMCNFPVFNPNYYNEVANLEVYANPAISASYEPGSTFKAITLAVALEAGVITPDTAFEDKGFVKVGGYKIDNALPKIYGRQTMTQVLEKSLNTGVVFAAHLVRQPRYGQMVKKFLFGQPLGVELTGEANGNINSLDKTGEIYLATASFGQGLTVTPLQMAMAFGALANKGKLYRPKIVDYIEDSAGQRQTREPQQIGQPISERTSTLISGMLTAVVEQGYSGQARVKGYYVAGKSGTAQVAGKDGQYSGETIHSFIGFAPVDKPRFVVLVKLDNVKAVRFAQSSAVPLFRDLAEFLLKYYGVPPSEK